MSTADLTPRGLIDPDLVWLDAQVTELRTPENQELALELLRNLINKPDAKWEHFGLRAKYEYLRAAKLILAREQSSISEARKEATAAALEAAVHHVPILDCEWEPVSDARDEEDNHCVAHWTRCTCGWDISGELMGEIAWRERWQAHIRASIPAEDSNLLAEVKRKERLEEIDRVPWRALIWNDWAAPIAELDASWLAGQIAGRFERYFEHRKKFRIVQNEGGGVTYTDGEPINESSAPQPEKQQPEKP